MTLLAPPECGSSTVQIAWLRPAFAILVALFGSTADAGPQAVPRAYQAGFYLEGCKDFLAGRSNRDRACG